MSTCASQPKTMYVTDVVMPSSLGEIVEASYRSGAAALGMLSTCPLVIYTVALVMLSICTLCLSEATQSV